MKKRALFLILPVVTLVLEILPYGAVCNFMNIDGDPWRITLSYFSLTPFGYANFGPFITPILTCIILAILCIYALKEIRALFSVAKFLLWVAVFTSLMPLLFGISFFSVVGGLISVCLVAELVMLRYSDR